MLRTTTKLPCYHVAASNGMTYGVAALSKSEAYSLLQSRLTTEDDDARLLSATRVAMWDASYGTVLCYGPTL